MRPSLISSHSVFRGVRGQCRVRGTFTGEPGWEKLYSCDNGETLKALRDCHRQPYLHSPRDWSEEGGEIYLAPMPVVSAEGEGPPRCEKADCSEIFRPQDVAASEKPAFKALAELQLDNDKELLRFAGRFGLPTQLTKSARFGFGVFCPVLRLQHDASVLRYLLRLNAELRRPQPDDPVLDRQIRALQRLWQDSNRTWVAVGDASDAQYPDYSPGAEQNDELAELGLPDGFLESLLLCDLIEKQDEAGDDSRRGRPPYARWSPMVLRAVNALKVGFARVLRFCAPGVAMSARGNGGCRARPDIPPPLRADPGERLHLPAGLGGPLQVTAGGMQLRLPHPFPAFPSAIEALAAGRSGVPGRTPGSAQAAEGHDGETAPDCRRAPEEA